jgi:hypothetical protein
MTGPSKKFARPERCCAGTHRLNRGRRPCRNVCIDDAPEVRPYWLDNYSQNGDLLDRVNAQIVTQYAAGAPSRVIVDADSSRR